MSLPMTHFDWKFKKVKTKIHAITISILTAFPLISWAGIVFDKDNILQQKISNASYDEVIRCSKTGNTRCNLLLGVAYDREISFKDQHINANSSKATFYFKKISSKSSLARYYLAGLLEYTRPLESKALILSAAKENEIHSIYDLGHPYYIGKSDEIIENIKWVKTLVDKHPDFLENEAAVIGSLYLLLTPPDYEKAAYWLTKASDEFGDLLAQGKLGKLYAEGLGVEKNITKAYMYYDLAGTSANENKQILARSITPEQINKAVILFHQWQDEHYSYRPGYGAWNDMGGTEWNVH